MAPLKCFIYVAENVKVPVAVWSILIILQSYQVNVDYILCNSVQMRFFFSTKGTCKSNKTILSVLVNALCVVYSTLLSNYYEYVMSCCAGNAYYYINNRVNCIVYDQFF